MNFVLVGSDKFGKITAADAGLGMTEWMPVFVGGKIPFRSGW